MMISKFNQVKIIVTRVLPHNNFVLCLRVLHYTHLSAGQEQIKMVVLDIDSHQICQDKNINLKERQEINNIAISTVY